jgi:hypothetical protein
MIDAFQAYQKFVAIKLHFNSDNYDFFKYNGRLKNTNVNNFEMRKDKYFFHKLSKHENVDFFLASNFFNKKKLWIGELFDDEHESHYKNALNRIQSLEYNLKKDLLRYESYNDALNVTGGQYPKLLLDYKRGDVSPETLVVLNDIYKIFNYWSEKIDDPIVWPTIQKDLENYGKFIKYDRKKFIEVLKEINSEF